MHRMLRTARIYSEAASTATYRSREVPYGVAMMRDMVRVIGGALLACALVNVSGQAQQVRCPQDRRSDEAATRFTVSVGTVTMPVGAFLLVRNGTQLGAIRLTSLTPGPNRAEGRSNYESFSLPDKSTSFTGNSVDHQTGDIYIGETVGVHAVFVHTKGHNQVLIGKWKFYFSFPDLINMSNVSFWKGRHDEGFEFAPTSACQLWEIDATDKRLRWFRWDKTTQVTLPLSDLPK